MDLSPRSLLPSLAAVALLLPPLAACDGSLAPTVLDFDSVGGTIAATENSNTITLDGTLDALAATDLRTASFSFTLDVPTGSPTMALTVRGPDGRSLSTMNFDTTTTSGDTVDRYTITYGDMESYCPSEGACTLSFMIFVGRDDTTNAQTYNLSSNVIYSGANVQAGTVGVSFN